MVNSICIGVNSLELICPLIAPFIYLLFYLSIFPRLAMYLNRTLASPIILCKVAGLIANDRTFIDIFKFTVTISRSPKVWINKIEHQ